MSLLFNTLSRFVTASLLRSKSLIISWLQSPSTVILEPKKIKSVTVSPFSPTCLLWSAGTRGHDLRKWLLRWTPILQKSESQPQVKVLVTPLAGIWRQASIMVGRLNSQNNVRWMSSSAFRRVRLVTCLTWWHLNKYNKEKNNTVWRA